MTSSVSIKNPTSTSNRAMSESTRTVHRADKPAPIEWLQDSGSRVALRALICSFICGGAAVAAVIPGAIIIGIDDKHQSPAGITLLSLSAAFALSCLISCCICKKASGN